MGGRQLSNSNRNDNENDNDNINEEMNERVRQIIRYVNERTQNRNGQEQDWTTIRIRKGQKNKITQMKNVIENVTNTRISNSFILDILLETANYDQIRQLITQTNVSNLLKGTDAAINKINTMLKIYRDEIRRIVPKKLLTEWYLCICERQNKAYKNFVITTNYIPSCFDFSDIDLLFNLVESWYNGGDIKRYLKNKIMKKAEKYYLYLMLFENAIKQKTRNDINNVNLNNLES